MQKIRLFVSSPTDVAAERRRVEHVVNRLKPDYEGLDFEVIRWEDSFYTARSTFQDQIASPADVDIVLCILWKRLGSPLPDDYQRDDGTTPTGTEYEFETAMEAALSGELPDILVYRKTAAISFDASHVEQEQAELQALESFWRRWIQNEKGHFTAGFKPFEDTDEFEQQLEKDLRAWLKRRFHHVTWPESKGSPYRGLDVFEEEHAAIYFGRRRAINEVRARMLANQQRDGIGFLLIIGASGAGKSSLVRAGLIPALKDNNPVEGVVGWRTTVLRPTELGTDPVHGLVHQLYEPGVLPEMSEGDYTQPRDLSDLCKQSPSMAAKPIESALKRWGRAVAQHEQLGGSADTRLLITIDQFEELFLFETEQQVAFLNVIDSLSRSPHIWIIATMRSDFYPQLFSLPELMTLKDASRQYDLSIPRPHELQDIISGPARAAGLHFEQDSHAEGLDQRLLEDAEGNPGALPLLEFTLERLYQERDRDNKQLTFSAYKKLGGLQGALTQTAEDAFTSIQNSFKDKPEIIFARVMRELVAIDEQGKATRRVAPVARFAANKDDQLLVDTLLEHRLLTGYTSETSDNDTPEAVVNITHEALIHHWRRVQQWLEQDQELLQVRERIDQDCQRWINENKRRDMLATSGKRLEDIRYLKSSGLQLGVDTSHFIDASLVRSRQLQKRKRILQAGFSALSIIAAIFGVITLNSLDELAQQRGEVREQKQILIKSKADSTALIAASEYAKASLLEQQQKNSAALASYVKAMANARESGEIRRGQRSASEERKNDKKSQIYKNWLIDNLRQPVWFFNALSDDNKLTSERSFYPLVSPDSNTALIIYRNDDTNVARLFRTGDKKPLTNALPNNIKARPFNMIGASFSPDSSRLAIVVSNPGKKKSRYTDSYSVKIINTTSGKIHDATLTGLDYVPVIRFLNNSDVLINSKNDNALLRWDTAQNSTLAVLDTLISTEDKRIEAFDVIDERNILINNNSLWQYQSKWINTANLHDVNPFGGFQLVAKPIKTKQGFINVVSSYDSWLPDWFMDVMSLFLINNYNPDSFLSNWIVIQLKPQIAVTDLHDNKVQTTYYPVALPSDLVNSNKSFIFTYGVSYQPQHSEDILFLLSFFNDDGDDKTYLYQFNDSQRTSSKPQLVLTSKVNDFKLITGLTSPSEKTLLFTTSSGEVIYYDKKRKAMRTLRSASKIFGAAESDKQLIIASDNGAYVVDPEHLYSTNADSSLQLPPSSQKLFKKYQTIYNTNNKNPLFPEVHYDNRRNKLIIRHKQEGTVRPVSSQTVKRLEKIGTPLTQDNNSLRQQFLKRYPQTTQLAMSSDYVAALQDNTVTLYRISGNTFTKYRRLAPSKDTIAAMQWHPRLPVLAMADWGGKIQLISADKKISTPKIGNKNGPSPLTRLEWRPDGKILASGDRAGNVILWSTENGQQQAHLNHDSGITALSFSQDSQWLVTATDTDKLYFWDANGKPLGSPVALNGVQISDVFVNRDNWGISVVDKSSALYFFEAGDRFIPDRVTRYIGILAENELFKQAAITSAPNASTDTLDYFINPPVEDKQFWTAMIHGLLACEKNSDCRFDSFIDNYFLSGVNND